MVGWMTVEFALIGLVLWVQAAYFVVGLVMIGLAFLCSGPSRTIPSIRPVWASDITRRPERDGS
jgi:hypothetical protein